MNTVEQSVDIGVPVRVAYNQWTQFETFPQILPSVERVEQVEPNRVRWHSRVAGKPTEWEAEIVEQIPDKRIAWKSVEGRDNAGCVTFHRLGPGETRVMVQMEYEQESVGEKVAEALGMVNRQVEKDLSAFKHFLEDRGRETGAWRGEIPSKSDRSPQA